MGVYKVDAASGLCGKADQQSRKNVENFLKKKWKYGEKVVSSVFENVLK